MQTLVVMALKVESQGLFEASGYKPFYCGVGAVKATHNLTKALLDLKPNRVINLGTAGSHRFQIGDLVECSSFVQRHTHHFFNIPTEIIYTKTITQLTKVNCGSADFIEQKTPQTACDIFDMEAYALAYVCKKMNIPFHAIKFITDSSNKNLMTDWKQNLKASAEALFNQLRILKNESQ